MTSCRRSSWRLKDTDKRAVHGVTASLVVVTFVSELLRIHRRHWLVGCCPGRCRGVVAVSTHQSSGDRGSVARHLDPVHLHGALLDLVRRFNSFVAARDGQRCRTALSTFDLESIEAVGASSSGPPFTDLLRGVLLRARDSLGLVGCGGRRRHGGLADTDPATCSTYSPRRGVRRVGEFVDDGRFCQWPVGHLLFWRASLASHVGHRRGWTREPFDCGARWLASSSNASHTRHRSRDRGLIGR
jgi:hypothetical protein